MMSKVPTFSWIDIDQVLDIAVKRFGRSADKARATDSRLLRVEPTLAVMRAGLTALPLADSHHIDSAVSLTKTIQNAVGLFHQDVLGTAAGWKSTGSSGGVIDVRGVSPVTGKQTLAEIKMRYNTIKASDEHKTWDKLKDAVALSGDGAVGYVFQIVPEKPESYDRPWKVSTREPLPKIRCADGVTAYHLVTGEPTALFELLHAMPHIACHVAETVFGDATQARLSFQNAEEIYEGMIAESIPAESALLRQG